MLLELLKRDCRLHYGALLLPFIFTLAMAGLYPFNPELPIFGPVLGFVFAAFLPLALHLREQTTGSLGDLTALPVARRQIVQLRFVEAILLPTALLLVSNLVMAAITRTLPGLPAIWMLRGLGWALFFCFAFFLPFALRWDGKGIVAAFALLSTVFTALTLVQFLPTRIHEAIWRPLSRMVLFFFEHPNLHTLLLVGLLALCYQVAIKAFASRDL
ncbi:MAG: ABC-2 transporter permease [Holophaga sp.]